MNFIIHCTRKDWQKEIYYQNSIVIDGNREVNLGVVNQNAEEPMELIRTILENLNIHEYVDLLQMQIDLLKNNSQNSMESQNEEEITRSKE